MFLVSKDNVGYCSRYAIIDIHFTAWKTDNKCDILLLNKRYSVNGKKRKLWQT